MSVCSINPMELPRGFGAFLETLARKPMSELQVAEADAKRSLSLSLASN